MACWSFQRCVCRGVGRSRPLIHLFPGLPPAQPAAKEGWERGPRSIILPLHLCVVARLLGGGKAGGRMALTKTAIHLRQRLTRRRPSVGLRRVSLCVSRSLVVRS